MKTVKWFLVFMLGLLISLSVWAGSESNSVLKESAYKTIVDFCQSEFNYNLDNRYDLIKMSPKYKEEGKKLGAFAGDLQIAYAYEIYAVKSYKILDLSVNNNKAIVSVSYDVLAKRTGWKTTHYSGGGVAGRATFIEYHKPNYIEKIHLTYDGKRWWVLDPPFPKISVKEIIVFLNEDISVIEKHHPEVKGGKFFPGPQDAYNDTKNNAAILKKLDGE